MSFWQILGRLAVSDQGETIQQLSDTTSVSSDGHHTIIHIGINARENRTRQRHPSARLHGLGRQRLDTSRQGGRQDRCQSRRQGHTEKRQSH